MKPYLFATAALFCATTAAADLIVTFDEGAPKDRFTFQNTGTGSLPAATLRIDLKNSAGGLVFDVTDQGAGVEVFQPFELTSGIGAVTKTSPVTDGDTQLAIDITGLQPNQKLAFTIDVDDTLGQREITVNDAEISGAEGSITAQNLRSSASFSGDTAVISVTCS
ncbi:MAG: aggregation factor core [Amylibacter sp.]|jgi:hypothetical protein|nr:aggregation factor core [Amylibacter sp.]